MRVCVCCACGVCGPQVRDEQGRRRFHGAFTGGFSAGYYNTVGTEKGWTPSTFQSSRDSRAKPRQMRPEVRVCSCAAVWLWCGVVWPPLSLAFCVAVVVRKFMCGFVSGP